MAFCGSARRQALILREQLDGYQVVAGSERYGIPRDEPVRCYDGDLAPLRAAARARGRIDDVSLDTGYFRRLTISSDDLGGGQTHYLYRCGPHGAQPLLAWGALPGFGVRAAVIAWLAWVVAGSAVIAMVRRRT